MFRLVKNSSRGASYYVLISDMNRVRVLASRILNMTSCLDQRYDCSFGSTRLGDLIRLFLNCWPAEGEATEVPRRQTKDCKYCIVVKEFQATPSLL
jgi:hypothetical protein